MSQRLQLLLKVAAVSLTGTAALVKCRSARQNDTLQGQMSQIGDALRNITKPPTVYVVGFKGHGKSSFLNTTCRVLNGEDGPLIFRSNTAPVGPAGTTMERCAVHVAGPEGRTVTLVDTPGLTLERLARADVEKVLRQGGTPAPDTVAFVLQCTDVPNDWELAVKKLAETVAVVIHELGLHLVVVLTHMKHLKSKKGAEMLRKEVAKRVRTDCVYFIENYIADHAINERRPIIIKNNFTTHNVTLAIMRQCVEFSAIHQSDVAYNASSIELCKKARIMQGCIPITS